MQGLPPVHHLERPCPNLEDYVSISIKLVNSHHLTFFEIISKLIDFALLSADNWHHRLDLLGIGRFAVLLFKFFPSIKKHDALRRR